MRTRRMVSTVAMAALALLGVACTDGEDAGPGPADAGTEDTAGADDADLGVEVVEHYADGVFASYDASLTSAEALRHAVTGFLADPTEQSLTTAREAWLAARDDYGLTEAFRFYGGPIDDEETGPEGRINAWPMDEAYVDHVEGDPAAGIVNDPDGVPELTAEVLAEANEAGGETNISTGWHAVEFLLWGQDLSTDGPGARPATDFTTAPNADRRGEYLEVVTDLLVADLTSLVEAWDPDGTDTYRAEFLDQPTDESLTRIITGIGELSRGELAGERMTVAYQERSQEDEHSCFSDNTTADLVANQQGVLNVWTGAYPGADDGPGLDELVASVDEDLSSGTTADMEAALAEIQSIGAPFDQHLVEGVPDASPGRTAILTSTELLGTQTDDLVEAATALGLTIEVS